MAILLFRILVTLSGNSIAAGNPNNSLNVIPIEQLCSSPVHSPLPAAPLICGLVYPIAACARRPGNRPLRLRVHAEAGERRAARSGRGDDHRPRLQRHLGDQRSHGSEAFGAGADPDGAASGLQPNANREAQVQALQSRSHHHSQCRVQAHPRSHIPHRGARALR